MCMPIQALLSLQPPIITALMVDSDDVYANTGTPQFAAVSKVFCPYFPIPDDFVANQIFFAVYSTNPIIQLDMIHYSFYSVCYKETEDPPTDSDPEYTHQTLKDVLNSVQKKNQMRLMILIKILKMN